MKRNIIFAAICILALSCEKEFDPNFKNQEAILNIVSHPGTSDTTVIFVTGASPVSKDTVSYDLSKTIVEMSVDGKDREVKYCDGTLPGLPEEKCWYSVGKVNPGEKIVVSVEDPALGKASSETTVPQPVKITSVETSNTANDEYTIFNIKLSGCLAEDYYAFSITSATKSETCSYSYILRDGVPDPDTVTEEWTYNFHTWTLTPEDDNYDSDLEMNVSDYITVNYDGWRFYDYYLKNSITLVKGKDISDGTIRIMTGYAPSSHNYEQQYNNSWGYPEYYYRSDNDYRIVFYHLTPECYRYAKSRYELYDNDLGMMGFAPSTFSYTNVSGGAGAVAALTASEPYMLEID